MEGIMGNLINAGETAHEGFTGLRDISTVERFSPERDGKCFADLASVLNRHEKSDRFVITLLHAHFPVGRNEAVVEHIDTSKRQVIKQVFQEEKSDAMPCVNWRLNERGLLPLEFTASPEQYDGAELTASDHICLADIRSTLAKHRALDRFGVGLFTRHLLDPQSEILLENASVAERTLKSRIASRTEFHPEESVETCWHVTLDGFWHISGCCGMVCYCDPKPPR
jgi:hypothetical protein